MITKEYQWEISGQRVRPYAYLREMLPYGDLLLRFVRRDFLAAYRQTVLGAAWILLQPLLTALVYVVVFQQVIGISTSGRPGLLFYFGGVVLWGFFSETLLAVSHTYTGQADIFAKVYFPRLIVPLSVGLSQLIRLGIQLGIYLLLFAWVYARGGAVAPNGSLLLVPLLLLLLGMMGLGLGLVFAALTLRYRDLGNLLSFILRIWMYASPVLFPLAAVPVAYRSWLLWNPLAPLLELFQYAFLGTGAHSPAPLLYAAGCACLSLLAGLLLFRNRDGRAMDIV